MLQVEMKNFRVFQDATFVEHNPLAFIVGMNEAGKSSFLEGIKFAFTGSAYGHKGKNTGGLIAYGETRMAVKVQLDGMEYYRTGSSGTTLKTVASSLGISSDVLPLLFDSRLCGDGGNRHMKAFFSSIGSAAFDPLAHFVHDSRVRPAIEAAKKAGCQTTAKIVKFCTDRRAGSVKPSQPIVPQSAEPTVEALQQAERHVQQAQLDLRSAESAMAEANGEARRLAQLAAYHQAVQAYEAQAAMARQTDPIAEDRQALSMVQNIHVESLRHTARMLQTVYPDLAQRFQVFIEEICQAMQQATMRLSEFPPPPPMPTKPVLSDELVDLARKFPNQEAITVASRELSGRIASLEQNLKTAQGAAFHASQVLGDMQKHAGAWTAYRQAMPGYEAAVAAATESWNFWNHAAHTIKDAEDEYLARAGARFTELVSDFSASVLNGRKVSFTHDEGLFLGPTNIEDCSSSTRWRVEIAVMAAIGTLLQSPLLLIDGADILDIDNRAALTSFLLARIVPNFTHVLLTTTAAGKIEDEKPLPSAVENVSKWTLAGGRFTKL